MLAVVSDVKIGIGPAVLPSLVEYYEADVVEMTDYELPQRAGSSTFGMPLSRRRWVSGEKYRFGFNGKEADDEWNGEERMLNYGFRIHDALLGRFLSVDPLETEYPWNSTYSFAENTPIMGVDLDGAELKVVVVYYQLEPDGSYTINGEKTYIHITNDITVQHLGNKYALTRVSPYFQQDDGRYYAGEEYNLLERLDGGLKPSAAYDYSVSGTTEKLSDDFEYIQNGNYPKSKGQRIATVIARDSEAPENRDAEDLLPLQAVTPFILRGANQPPAPGGGITKAEGLMRGRGTRFSNSSGKPSGTVYVVSRFSNQAKAISSANYYFNKATKGLNIEKTVVKSGDIIRHAEANGHTISIRTFNTGSSPSSDFGLPAATITVKLAGQKSQVFKFNY